MIKVSDVSKKYKDKKVLSEINLTFDKGVIGILGANGAGKTTLFRCILGLEKHSGNIDMDEACIGYLPQNFSFFKELTVIESLEYISYMKNVESPDINDLIKQVGLEEFRDKRIGKLSGGMLRRLGICQTLIGNPDVVILDEPTVGLDPEARVYIRNLLARISIGKTVLISSHIASDLDYLCDYVLILDKGKVQIYDSKEKIIESIRGKVFERVVSEEEAKNLDYISLIRQSGILRARCIGEKLIDSIEVEPTLEDAFFYYKGLSNEK